MTDELKDAIGKSLQASRNYQEKIKVLDFCQPINEKALCT